ncbi:hypothetical protein EDD21DRAFT_310721 [Dissophora ornata]|nr:hypothetical protein EDD21DRAFT_310721 [Dissophora ornata]
MLGQAIDGGLCPPDTQHTRHVHENEHKLTVVLLSLDSATCIKGHRSTTCNHGERPLHEIKKKGRPSTQCAHCKELRKAKQVNARCICGREEGTIRTHVEVDLEFGSRRMMVLIGSENRRNLSLPHVIVMTLITRIRRRSQRPETCQITQPRWSSVCPGSDRRRGPPPARLEPSPQSS